MKNVVAGPEYDINLATTICVRQKEGK